MPAQSDESLLKQLERHVRILADHKRKAFVERNDAYTPEVAAKLRVLICRSRTNKPLLLDLMKKHGIELSFEIDRPQQLGGPITVTLDEFIELEACRIRTPNGLERLTKKEITLLVANKSGSHEDWSYPHRLTTLLEQPMFVNGLQAARRELNAIAGTVIWAANEFFKELRTASNSS